MKATTAAATLLLLTGCSSAPQPAATSTSTSHTANVADVAYLAAVRPSVQGSTDADLIALGKQACTDLDTATVLDVAAGLQSKGMSTAASASIATAAIAAYCPQHKDKLSP